jgi:methylated-DNA-[protein]-cysteine S-methyltransferase
MTDTPTLTTTVPDTTVLTTTVASPLGRLRLTASDGALTGLSMEEQRHRPPASPAWVRDDAWFAGITAQLGAYFAGELTEFDVPIRLEGTDFQRRVWQGLRTIPYGETVSYVELARRAGSPAASRAVGQANGRNPVAVIVPCHRVIAADGSLGGYGGGLERKARLLELEQHGRGAP